MPKNIEHLIHKKSVQLDGGKAKAPAAGSIEYGEIAINYSGGNETIFIKNNENDIVAFAPYERTYSDIKDGLATDGEFVSALTSNADFVEKVASGISGDFQEKLVSGVNIKTVNGDSILGSGNVETTSVDEVNQLIENYVGTGVSSSVTVTDLFGTAITESDTVTVHLEALSGLVSEDERVTAAAFNALSGYISTTNETVSGLNSNLTAHTSNTGIHVTAADKEKWNNAGSTAEAISGEVASLSGTVTGLSETVNGLTGDVNTLSGTVTGLSDTVETISGNVNTLSGNVSTLSGNVNAISGAVSGINNTLSAHTANTNIHVTSDDKTAWNAKLDGTVYTASGSDIITSAQYYTSGDTHEIRFFNHNNKQVGSAINANDFIKDGMVSNVEVKDVTSGSIQVKCVVVSFNTDAGSEDINIPVSEIFDPTNYYNTSEIGSGVTGQISTANTLVSQIKAIDNKFGTGVTTATTGTVTAQLAAITGDVSTINTKFGTGITTATTGTVTAQLAAITGNVSTISGTVTGINNTLSAHTADTSIHLSSSQKTNLDAISGNIATLSAISSTSVTNWNTAYQKASGITGDVGTMAYEDKTSYSSATQVSTALSGKVGTGRTISTASGLTGGGDLSANRTIGLVATGTAGTYKQVEVDVYGRVTSGNNDDNNSWREIKVNGTSFIGSGSSTPLNVSGGTNVTVTTDSSGLLTISAGGGMTPETTLTGYSHDSAAYTNTSGDSSGYSSYSGESIVSTSDSVLTALKKLEKAIWELRYLVGKHEIDKYNTSLAQIISDNEMVTSAALNDLNARIAYFENQQ